MQQDETSPLRIASQLVGLGAGFVGLIYACGSFVVAMRLLIWGLPLEVVLGQLPRDFILSVGLAQVILPSAAIAAGYGAYRFLRGRGASPPKTVRWADAGLGGRTRIALAALPWALVIAAPGIILPIIQEATSRAGTRPDLALLVIPLALVFLITLLARQALTALGKRFSDTWNHTPAVLLATLVVFAAVAPGFLNLASALPPTESSVCTREGGASSVLALIGQTNDKVFLAGKSGGQRELLVIPQSEVTQVSAGAAEDVPCLPNPD